MSQEQELQDLADIQRLLDEAYAHYFANGDGHCKSSEGNISLHFNNYFERRDGEAFGVKYVEVYSYVFGPNRSHWFNSTAEALATVKQWRKREMQTDYDDNGEVLTDENGMIIGWDLSPEYDWQNHEGSW